MAETRRDLQTEHRRQKKRESLLETLESIVVAFILAFIFRAFLIEAFVIPTGSMAATLYGQHLEFECTSCGTEFAVGLDDSRARPGEPYQLSKPLCPNCFFQQDLGGDLERFHGDRILVLKYIYDFCPPERWDVVVFRFPLEPKDNFIKRLVGLPGETLELRDGDLAVRQPGQEAARVVQKPDDAQEALWMLVHDTRHRPTHLGWEPRWFGEGWRREDDGYLLATPGKKTAWLTYHHRNAYGRPAPIQDFYAYNTGSGDEAVRLGTSHVKDLCVRGPVTVTEPGTTVLVELRSWKDTVRVELTPQGSGRPSRALVGKTVVAEAAGGVLPVGEAADVRAAVVDEKVMVLVGGRRVLTPRTDRATPEGDPIFTPTPVSEAERDRITDSPAGPAGVRVGGQGGRVRLGYLRLDRDIHYFNCYRRMDGLGSVPGAATAGHPFTLGADEFFVMGDNSPRSYDSREWPLERPVVPRRNLVGRAFFVYWPAAGDRLGLIPILPDPTGFRFVH